MLFGIVKVNDAIVLRLEDRQVKRWIPEFTLLTAFVVAIGSVHCKRPRNDMLAEPLMLEICPEISFICRILLAYSPPEPARGSIGSAPIACDRY